MVESVIERGCVSIYFRYRCLDIEKVVWPAYMEGGQNFNYLKFCPLFAVHLKRTEVIMDFSFTAFVQNIFSSPILFITVLLTLGVIFVKGGRMRPNAMLLV